MNNSVCKLLLGTVKINLIIGIFGALIIFTLLSIHPALAFLLGVVIACINFLLNGYVTERLLNPNKVKISWFIYLSFFLRISIILCMSLFFINNIKSLIAYIIGFISQFVGLSIYWFINQRGSD